MTQSVSVFIHPEALVESTQIGESTRVWAFAHILEGAIIGKDCNICDHVFIENEVKIGDRVTIKCGVQIWDGIKIDDDVFIGPNATFCNDLYPRSKEYPEAYLKTTIKKGASIGANATILPGITIGERAMVGAGSVVTKDVKDGAVVVGNPAREVSPDLQEEHLFETPLIEEKRGNLTFGEIEEHLPFLPKRYFTVFDAPKGEIRGGHAHQTMKECLICVKGACKVTTDNGNTKREYMLDSPTKGLYFPQMTWSTQEYLEEGTILVVFASEKYRKEGYLYDYQEYLQALEKAK